MLFLTDNHEEIIERLTYKSYLKSQLIDFQKQIIKHKKKKSYCFLKLLFHDFCQISICMVKTASEIVYVQEFVLH